MLQIIAICTGASIGACTRWQLGLWLNQQGAGFPWGTLSANWLGAYGIGIFIAIFQQIPNMDPAWRLAVMTGFFGGLTTFSTFSADMIQLLQSQRYGAALANASLNVLGSLMLTAAGIQTIHWLWPRP